MERVEEIGRYGGLPTPRCQEKPTNRKCSANWTRNGQREVAEWEMGKNRKMGVTFDAFDVVAVANYRPISHDFCSDFVCHSLSTWLNGYMNMNITNKRGSFFKGLWRQCPPVIDVWSNASVRELSAHLGTPLSSLINNTERRKPWTRRKLTPTSRFLRFDLWRATGPKSQRGCDVT